MATEVFTPIEGKVLKISVKPGDQVQVEDQLFVLEAFKMENPICAEQAGVVKEIKIKENDMVKAEQVVLILE
jgi:biotin carboxyl carrier protein